jgi:steroid delta-isomerase-like uncharacterized protein
MSEQNNLKANKALIRRWFEEVWNKGRPEAIREMMAEGCINHGLSENYEPMDGPKDFLPFHSQFREAFPEIEVVVEDAIAEGDRVAVRCSVRGKHQGDSLGFKATGTTAEFDGIAIARIKDGMFVETWNNFDFMRMYKQLGAI